MANQPAFTRLPPGSVNLTRDLYDKLQAVGGQVDSLSSSVAAQKTAQEQTIQGVQSSVSAIQRQIGTPGTSTFIPSIRQVAGGDAFIGFSDYTVVLIITVTQKAALPDATRCVGQIFVVKNSKGSGGGAVHVSMDSTNSQTIDGAAASTVTLSAGGCLTVQSDGMNWIVLDQH